MILTSLRPLVIQQLSSLHPSNTEVKIVAAFVLQISGRWEAMMAAQIVRFGNGKLQKKTDSCSHCFVLYILIWRAVNLMTHFVSVSNLLMVMWVESGASIVSCRAETLCGFPMHQKCCTTVISHRFLDTLPSFSESLHYYGRYNCKNLQTYRDQGWPSWFYTVQLRLSKWFKDVVGCTLRPLKTFWNYLVPPN